MNNGLGKTHKWMCYIRGVKGEDISYFVKKVVFNLHPSFPNPKKGTTVYFAPAGNNVALRFGLVIDRFPFEIHESGTACLFIQSCDPIEYNALHTTCFHKWIIIIRVGRI
jgi:hypothetical protein